MEHKNDWCKDDLVAAMTLAIMLGNDALPVRADALCVFGHTREHEKRILDRVSALHTELGIGRLRPKICLSGEAPYAPSGEVIYAGGPAWRASLVRWGIPLEDIECVPQSATMSNIATEAQAFVEWTRKSGYSRIVLVSISAHPLRTLCTTLACLQKEGKDLPQPRFYTAAAPSNRWTQKTHGSQGVGQTEEKLVRDEIDKLNTFYRKGHLVSCQDAIEYIRWRDTP